MRIFEQLESRVRGYVRSFPVIFRSAKGSIMTDTNGKDYIDFFAGAGTLNYGHNNDRISQALIEYIQKDGPVHGLDMATLAKRRFLTKLNDTIRLPRNLDYKVQFTGPTGTNAVETALLAENDHRQQQWAGFARGRDFGDDPSRRRSQSWQRRVAQRLGTTVSRV